MSRLSKIVRTLATFLPLPLPYVHRCQPLYALTYVNEVEARGPETGELQNLQPTILCRGLPKIIFTPLQLLPALLLLLPPLLMLPVAPPQAYQLASEMPGQGPAGAL